MLGEEGMATKTGVASRISASARAEGSVGPMKIPRVCCCDTGPRLGGKVHDPGCALVATFGAVMSFYDAREWVKAELDKVLDGMDCCSKGVEEMQVKVERIKRGLYW